MHLTSPHPHSLNPTLQAHTQKQVSQRGKNAKKKRQAKYSDQDEDERVAAMLMLGHKNVRAEGAGGYTPPPLPIGAQSRVLGCR